ncbi:MAG: sigma-70 family RNA polymerase sigma factor [Armatimonadetes bacterium]|nr:sigma-70 family RNA polymerase sigma factor [Armatimonadota bacterium]
MDFNPFIQEHQHSVFALALSRLGHEEVAADVTQEAFVSLYKAWHLFTDGQTAEDYLWQAASRHCEWESVRGVSR